jgi:hypothetical protein
MLEDELADVRNYAQVPGDFDVSDLVVTLPEAYAQDFVDWHEDFVVKGDCSDGDELKGDGSRFRASMAANRGAR